MQRIICPRPQCGKRLKYGPEHAGKQAKCQKCGQSFRLPGSGEFASADGKSLVTSSTPAVPMPAGNDNENATPTTARSGSSACSATRALWGVISAMLILGLVVSGAIAVGVLRGLAGSGVAPLYTGIGAVVLAFVLYFVIEEMS